MKNARPLRIVGDTAFVPLTKGYEAIIDADVAERVGRHNWCAADGPSGPAAHGRVGGITVMLHRFIARAPDGAVVDHINRNRLDNRRINLRLCSRAENCRNAVRDEGGELPTGVLRRSPKTFEATVRLDGRTYSLGRYRTVPEAAAARRVGEMLLHGEFSPAAARANLPKVFKEIA